MMRQAGEQRERQVVAKIARYQELLDAIREARFLARAGQRGEGYRRLLMGARGGQVSLQTGEPWAGDLTDRYRLALESYARQFRLAQEPQWDGSADARQTG